MGSQLIAIPFRETDGELNLNRNVLDFTARLFSRGITVIRPSPNDGISARYLEIAENNQFDHKVRFIALCLGAAFSNKEYVLYRKIVRVLLKQINADVNHHNALINYYAIVLSALHPTEVISRWKLYLSILTFMSCREIS